MPSTYEPIATSTLSSTASIITFSSISGTYTDLVLVVSCLDNGASRTRLRLNGDSATNYSRINLVGNGVNPNSYSASNETLFDLSVAAGTSSTNPTAQIISINNYSNTTTNKTILSRYSLASGAVEAMVGLYRSTAAITSVSYFTLGTMQIGTTATLYGIKAA
jgi:hypothetical protein